VISLVLTLGALAGALAINPQPNAAAAAILGGGRIQHVVFLIEENHSFDNVLGLLCSEARAGQITRSPCDGATTGQLPDGTTIPLAQASDVVPEVAHDVAAQEVAIHKGKMDGFGLIRLCGALTHYRCYSQFDPSQIPNASSLATTYAVSDRTFEFRSTPSWIGHAIFAAATLDGFQGDNPVQSTYTTETGPGVGCDSFRDALWRDETQNIRVPSCVPDRHGLGPYRASPVLYVPTIFDRMEAAGRTWRIYGGSGHPTPTVANGYNWSICPTFYECLGSPQYDRLVPASQVIADAGAGKLPDFSIVTPRTEKSQHNTQSMAEGDNWIGSVVAAIQNGPDASSTAIIITWDDCGCFYDHVPPPRRNWGIREPVIIVSPFAKQGFTDSTPATFLAMLAFAEHSLGVRPVNARDRGSYDYANAFDFTQVPLGPVRMTTTPVPAWEREWIAEHPMKEDDPT
jgi:phospholipase C